ncbi:MAG: hypothetical protein EGQ09_00880 [Clostridiales bacterium]|nr:hypothetical protein [Clostridiales bacterium]
MFSTEVGIVSSCIIRALKVNAPKNRQHPDKLTAELLFFCFWLTRCGEVELGCFESYGLENYGQHSPSSYRRRFISDPPVEDFAPAIRFDSEDDRLRRLARLTCMAASVLVPDGSLEAFDNTIEDYRRYALHYPDYHAAYEGLDPRTLRRDKQAVRQVLLRWRDYDARRMQRDEDVEEELTAEFKPPAIRQACFGTEANPV